MSELAKRVVQEGITVRQLELLVQQMTEPTETKEKKQRQKIAKPSYILESEERLMDRFGTSVQITPKGEQGKIEIEYLSPNDLDRILELLNVEFDD